MWAWIIDYLRAVEEVGQFLGQIRGRGWRRGRIVRKMVDVRSQEDQTRIHRVRVFLRLDLFVGVRMPLELVVSKGLL